MCMFHFVRIYLISRISPGTQTMLNCILSKVLIIGHVGFWFGGSYGDGRCGLDRGDRSWVELRGGIGWSRWQLRIRSRVDFFHFFTSNRVKSKFLHSYSHSHISQKFCTVLYPCFHLRIYQLQRLQSARLFGSIQKSRTRSDPIASAPHLNTQHVLTTSKPFYPFCRSLFLSCQLRPLCLNFSLNSALVLHMNSVDT